MSSEPLFTDRAQAGRLLGEKLRSELAPPTDALVLGLVRGGALIARHLAQAAGLAWDILIVRKIGAPRQPEYAVGAYAETGDTRLNEDALRYFHLDQDWINRATSKVVADCARLQQELRSSGTLPPLAGRTVILTDDGIATGFTMFAAIDAVRGAQAARVIAAVPVLSPDARRTLEAMDVALCYIACPAGFHAVGQYYNDFSPVTSAEVRELLNVREQGRCGQRPGSAPTGTSR